MARCFVIMCWLVFDRQAIYSSTSYDILYAWAGKYDDPDDPGDVTHFQHLQRSVSGTHHRVHCGILHWTAVKYTPWLFRFDSWLPSESNPYRTAKVHSVYLTAVPKNAVIHIQNNAPGPP